MPQRRRAGTSGNQLPLRSGLSVEKVATCDTQERASSPTEHGLNWWSSPLNLDPEPSKRTT